MKWAQFIDTEHKVF